MATNQNAADVSDKLLESFDNTLAAGDTLPVEELKKRYRSSEYFRVGAYRQSQIYRELLSLPISTADAVRGQAAESVTKIVDGITELRPEEVIVEYDGDGDTVTVTVREWQPEEQLRKAWREFAEDEYKSENLGGAS